MSQRTKSQAGKKATHQVAISEFKAKCLSLLDEVNKTKIALRVTKRGKAIADVVPPHVMPAEDDWLGSMSARTKILGDIVSPVIKIEEIEAMED